ncbi:PREDICTED: carbonic anhydrase 1-like [Nestor notabilis]|uniref:carbonic anhydrase 1-like n=1 Tax=Nestor notabilis TaxID=176057 RepID=UPI00052342E6|nr:PREDICTED: carbonic anhydrase 1-like [Nestor notabilis]
MYGGPDQWHKLYPIANRDHQSPTKPKDVKKGVCLRLLQIIWKPSTCKEIVNFGQSFHVDFEDKDDQSVLTSGPLTGTWRLRQFHSKDQTDEQGSEHTMGGRIYASEDFKFSYLQIGLCKGNLKAVLKALDSVKTKMNVITD